MAAVLAALCCLAWGTRIDRDFKRIRHVNVAADLQSVGGVINVPLPDLSDLDGYAAAIIVRARNQAPEPVEIVLSLDGVELGRRTIDPGRIARAELGVDATIPLRGTLTFAARSDWSLASLEIANIHGHNLGVPRFVVVPRAAPNPVPPPSWLLLLFSCGFVAAWATHRFRSRSARAAHAVSASLALLMLGAALLAPVVSDFKVFFSFDTFAFCVVLLQLPLLARIAGALGSFALETPLAGRRAVRSVELVPVVRTAVVTTVCVLFVGYLASYYDAGTGFTSIIRFGGRWEQDSLPAVQAVPRAIVNDSGYDGQFYAQLAVDPLLLDPGLGAALDTPRYRARRILFSWTAYLLGLGQPAWILQAYALQGALCWALLALLLRRWLPLVDVRNILLWAAVLLNHGLLTSVSRALLEGPSLLLQAASMAVAEGGRLWSAAVILGVAGLARETNLLWGAELLGGDADRSAAARARRLAGQGLVLVVPLLLWVLYVSVVRELAGFATGSSNFGPPLSGLLAEWRSTLDLFAARGWSDFRARQELLMIVGCSVQMLVLLVRPDYRNAWWRVGAAYAVLAVFLGPGVWAGAPTAAYRILLPMSLAYNIRLPRDRWFWPLLLLGNTAAIAGVDELLLRWPWDPLHWW